VREDVLVTAELVRLCPAADCPAELFVPVNQLMAMSLRSPQLGRAQHAIVDSVNSAIRIAVRASANPIAAIAAAHSGDPFAVLRNFRIATWSIATFRDVLIAVPPVLPHVAADQRARFADRLYTLISGFYLRCPKQYGDLLRSRFGQAQTLVEMLLPWRLEPEYLALFGALLPFCPALVDGISAKGKAPGSQILQAIADYKQKKDTARYSVACAILELQAAVLLVDGQYLKPISDFTGKIRAKFEADLLAPKRREPALSGKLLEAWLPRYAAVEYAREEGSTTGPAMNYLFASAEKGGPREPMINFVAHIYQGYPREVNVKLLRGAIFTDYCVHFAEALSDVVRTRASYSIAKRMAKFFANDSPDFALFAILAMHNLPAALLHNSRQMKALRLARITPMPLESMLTSAIQIVASQCVNNIIPFVRFLRSFFACDASWGKFLANIAFKDAMWIVVQIATSFRIHVERGFLLASPSISALLLLLLRSLKWTKLLFDATAKEGAVLSDVLVPTWSYTIYILMAATHESALANCDSVIGEILRLFRVEQNWRLPSTVLETGDEVVVSALKSVVIGWFGYVMRVMPTLSIFP
jgi:hypothetical protein